MASIFLKIHTSSSVPLCNVIRVHDQKMEPGSRNPGRKRIHFPSIFHWSLAAMQAAIEMSSRDDEAEGLKVVVFFSA